MEITQQHIEDFENNPVYKRIIEVLQNLIKDNELILIWDVDTQEWALDEVKYNWYTIIRKENQWMKKMLQILHDIKKLRTWDNVIVRNDLDSIS